MNPSRSRTAVLVALALAVVLVVGVLVARAVRPDDVASPAASPPPSRSASPTPSPSPTAAEPTAPPSPTAAPTEAPAGSADDVVLGLGGSFGEELWQPEDLVLGNLTAALDPPDETVEGAGCADGTPRRVHRWGDFTVSVALEPLDPSGTVPGLEPVEPPFVDGWVLRGPSPALRTLEGLAIGDTVADVMAVYPDAYPSPAEPNAFEVFKGDFSNLWIETTSTEATGTVTAMVSGTDCAAG